MLKCFRSSDRTFFWSHLRSNFKYVRMNVYLFIWERDLNYPQRWNASMAVGGGFFDQYSVFCVFGSVVGCVVVPLITQVGRFLFLTPCNTLILAQHSCGRVSENYFIPSDNLWCSLYPILFSTVCWKRYIFRYRHQFNSNTSYKTG